MVIVRLKDGRDLLSKLKVVLDDAMERGENHIILLAESTFYERVSVALDKHNKIGKVIVGGKALYCIKGMRIEIEPIEYTI
jgi:hypothetical protein